MSETSRPITVGLAGTRRDVSARLSEALTAVPDIACVLASATDDALRLVRAQPVDVMLVDLYLAPAGAVGLLDPMFQASPETKPVILVPPGGDFDSALLVGHGARGFLSAHADGPMVRRCVRTVHAGEYWLALDQVAPLQEHLRQGVHGDEGRTLDVLTPREHEIVRAVLRGASNGAIASDFALSPETVRKHLSSIYLKLGVSTRLELALLVMHLQKAARP